ncbi:MAG TPA: isoprenylcysteine carboxylmethyltransferase family protein [Xanthobacteraceae bacterium]|nr:isoprenylcysteine carboxylmethyltransferase family protein [Xanthobacteraceae bacterium]
MPEFLLLGYVTIERLAEVLWSARNEAGLRGQGAIEHGAEHYPFMVALHAAWLAGLWVFAWGLPANGWAVAAFVLVQGLRFWILTSLGRRWTTRVLVLPGKPLVASGPYRWLRHPNYWVVAAEVALVPLAFGLVGYAIVFSLLNGVMLALRIRVENRALAEAARTR